MVHRIIKLVDKMKKKGQQTGSQAAMVIGIITLLAIFYIMFLPPEDRAALLGTDTGSGSGIASSSGQGSDIDTSNIIFQENIGKIDYQGLDSLEYDLSAVHIYQTEHTEIFGNIGSIFVRKGWFQDIRRDFVFEIDDLENTFDIILSVTLRSKPKGDLVIKLNGEEIYNYPPKGLNLEPISLKQSQLKEGENRITFSASDVGMKFWTANEIGIEDAKVVGKVSDLSRSESENSFYISEDEGTNIEKAVIRFFPDCNPKQVGPLTIRVNSIKVFRGIPDCGILNRQVISPGILMKGSNRIDFSTEEGSYLIDQISVKASLMDQAQPTYYFDLDESLFMESPDKAFICGDTDGVCPDNCGEDLDRDCCFEEYIDGFWCDVKTDYIDDRCVGHMGSERCGVCRSGYEDEDGNPPEACEGLCGDDEDGLCPEGCSAGYDKDCCFERPGSQFWCEDLPDNGEDFICVDSLTYDSCGYCPEGYKGEDSSPDCRTDDERSISEELKEGKHIVAEFRFTDRGTRKEAVIYINGHESGFDTNDESFSKRIDRFVEPGTNSLRLVPKSDLDIRELLIKVEE